MKIADQLKIAFKNVRNGGVKTALCSLALCIGICSVCTISFLGDLASTAVSNEIEQTGIGGITFYSNGEVKAYFEKQDIIAAGNIDGVQAAMPFSMQTGYVSATGDRKYSAICGVDQSLSEVFNITLLHGRLLSSKDVSSQAKVVVIDDALATQIYKRENIVGKSVKISIDGVSDTFEVIGVIESQKQGIENIIGSNIPSFIYTPYTSLNSLCGKNTVDTIAISCFSGADSEATSKTVSRTLKEMHDLPISYQNLDNYTGSLKNITEIVSAFAGGIAAISIFVGGIGVMNSMVASVESRINEIGIYMALGAKKSDILKLFSFEAILMCLFGGAAGSVLSVSIFMLVKILIWPTAIFKISYLLYGVVIASACGIFFGIIPAYKAASLSPIDAIKKE